jgi:hypothetical protein
MKYEITLNEDHIAFISDKIGQRLPEYALPKELVDAMRLFRGADVDSEDLERFLIIDGVFNIKRAVSRVIKGCASIPTESYYYYLGSEGWKKGQGLERTILRTDYYGRQWSERISGRVRIFDETLNIAKSKGVFPELLEAIVIEELLGSLNTNCRIGLIGWIIENDFHKDERVIKQFLRGYFKGNEKTQIMEALVEDKELSKLELFWKSRAFSVKEMFIEIAPVKDLPFLLETKNPKLLKLIEKRMAKIVASESVK